MNSGRIRERDLVDPVLKLIHEHGDEHGGLDVTRLDQLLRQRLTLSDADKMMLKGRKDDRFSQVVRNLVSHRTLEKDGLAEYLNTGTYKRGAYYLTPKGAARIGRTLRDSQQPDLFD
ncbi:MAG TPA: hypothetical protein DCS30_14000 [Rhizobiales bacterium]|nr:hypothetical protein [Hyphomicrobiales bacterium]